METEEQMLNSDNSLITTVCTEKIPYKRVAPKGDIDQTFQY